ncbi:MAG: hypothetical protein KDK25_02195 [Leptospiraceae bacterium]|nr:hypothetical protein [Leptospiraceae bacterium]
MPSLSFRHCDHRLHFLALRLLPGLFLALCLPLSAQTIDLGTMQARYSRPEVVFFPDGQGIAIASDKIVRSYTLEGKLIRTYQSYLNIKGLAISPDGSQLATAESDDGGNVNGLVKVVDVKSGRLLRQFRHRSGYVEWLSFSPDGRYLASVGDESAVYVWDLRTGRPAARMTDHTWGNVSAVHFSRDGRFLFSGGQYRDEKALIKAKEAEDRYYNKSHSKEEAMRLQNEINKWYEIFNASWRIGELFVYSTDNWKLLRRMETPGAVHGIQSFADSTEIIIATNMDRMQVAGGEGSLLSVDPSSGEMEKLDTLAEMPDDFEGINSEHRFYYRHNVLRYVPGAERFLVSELDEVQVLDDDMDEIFEKDIDPETIQSPVPAALSPDGKLLVTLEYNRQTGKGTAVFSAVDD